MESHKLTVELKKSNGYKLFQSIRKFSISLSVFNKNYQELKKHILFQTQKTNAFRLMRSQHSDELENVQLETVRLLHNYIASALSLIDHTRVYYNELYKDKSEIFPEYQEEINKRFVENPLSNFVKCFRQYIQHFKSPLISNVSNLTRTSDDIISKITLSKEDIFQFSKWTKYAKQYIDKLEGDLDIDILVTDYNEIIQDFYKWFHNRQGEIHKEDFEELLSLDKKVKEARLVELVEEYTNSGSFNNEYFRNQIRSHFSENDKIIFDRFSNEMQLDLMIKFLKSKNQLNSKKESIIREKYTF